MSNVGWVKAPGSAEREATGGARRDPPVAFGKRLTAIANSSRMQCVLNSVGAYADQSFEAARVHYASRRRCGVAGDGARAAGEAADCRVFGREGSQWVAAFERRLRELGWIEGRTVAIEYRWAEGRSERYSEIAAEFVRLKVEVSAS